MWEIFSITEKALIVFFQLFFQKHDEPVLICIAEDPAQHRAADIGAERIVVLVVIFQQEPGVFYQTQIAVNAFVFLGNVIHSHGVFLQNIPKNRVFVFGKDRNSLIVLQLYI